MTYRACRAVVAAFIACGIAATSSQGAVRPEPTPLAEKAFRDPALSIPTRLQAAGDAAFYDPRAERLTSFLLREPLIPGTGQGNRLRWPGGRAPRDEAAVRAIV